MEERFESVLDGINITIAFVILYLGLRILSTMRFTLQRRSVYLFIVAATLFTLQEILAFVVNNVAGFETLDRIREIIETAFIACLATAMYWIVRSEQQEITALRQSATTDQLTQLPNIASFRQLAARRIMQATEYQLPLALIMLDVDNFKHYNDRYGHEAGNVALQAVAQTLRDTARTDDLIARYGGEEFVALITVPCEAAVAAAERVRAGIEATCTEQHTPPLCQSITVSIGVAPYAFTAATKTVEELIELADTELYRAKQAGKNRVSAPLC
jgi:diguanylate cyclase (GGDEF)-like protein